MGEQEKSVEALYIRLVRGWNDRDAAAMAACFSETATMIGFDGSLAVGRDRIEAHLSPIFRNHPTAAFVTVIREIRSVGAAMLLRADVGMVPPGRSEINAATNARQVVVARRKGEGWEIELFQNTPAALHGDADGQRKLSQELNAAFATRGAFPD